LVSAAGKVREVTLRRAASGSGSSVAVAAVVEESAVPLHNNLQPFLCVNFIMAVEGQIPEKE
jgi:microcystin-dependent protein